MASVKVAVSLPEALFDELEEAAMTTGTPRSQIVAEALRQHLRRRQTELLRQQISAAYADGPDADERAAMESHRRMERGMVRADAW